MFQLTKRARSALAIVGAILACGGFALVPLYGRPAGETVRRAALSADSPAEVLVADTSARIRQVVDPFARPLLAQNTSVSQTGSRPATQERLPFVRAIVAGARARALLAFGDGSVHIVALGDTVGSARVAAIEPDAVVLSDGRRMVLAEARQ